MRPLQQATRKSELTRQALMDAALEFLWSNPYRELSVLSITQTVGVSRSSFYQYFPDIHGLLKVLLDELQVEFQVLVESTWMNHPTDPQAELKDTLELVYKIAYGKGPVFRATTEAAPMSNELCLAWDRFVSGFDVMVSEAIKRDQAAGIARASDALAMAQALNRMNVGLIVHHFGQRPRTQLKRVVPTAVQIWTCSIYGD